MAKSSKKNKKTRKSKAPKGGGCSFTVNVAEFDGALARINRMLGADGIPTIDIMVAFRTDVEDGKLVFQAGTAGSYVEMSIDADVHTKGMFVTNIVIPWLSYGSKDVTLTVTPDGRAVEYKGRIKGRFITLAGKLKEIEGNRREPKKLMKLPYSTLNEIVSRTLFDADVLEDHEDVIIMLEVKKLDKPEKSKKAGVKRKGEKDKKVTHYMRAVVFDRQRAAVVEKLCEVGKEMPLVSFGSGHLYTFLQACQDDERKGAVSVSITDDFIYMATPTFTSITPAVENVMGDITEEFLGQFKDKDALFTVDLDTDEHIQPFNDVLSVQGGPRSKLSASADAAASQVAVTVSKNKVNLSVKGNVASGSTSFKPLAHKGTGRIALDGIFVVDALSIVGNKKVRLTVWPKMVRQVVLGERHTYHYYATVTER